MSQISRAILGAMAVSLTVGAVQFASGHDLTGGLGTTIGTTLGANLGTSLGTGLKAGFGTTVAAATPSGINRAAKADRAAEAVERRAEGPARRPATMIVFGCAVTDGEAYERWAAPGIERAGEPDSAVYANRAEGSIFRAYNVLLDLARSQNCCGLAAAWPDFQKGPGFQKRRLIPPESDRRHGCG